MKYIIITIYLLCSGTVLMAQNQKLIDSLEQAIKLSKGDTNEVNLLNKLAFQYVSYNHTETGKLLSRSINLARQLHYQRGLAGAYSSMGILNKNMKKYDSSLMYHQKSLEIWEVEHNERSMASVHNNMGRTYTEKGDYTNGMEEFLKSLKLREKLKDSSGMAAAYNNIGNIYYNKRDFKKAKEYSRKSLAINTRLGDSFEMARNLREVGYNHYYLNEYDSALICYNHALSIFKEMGAQAECSRLMNNIGNVLVELHRVDESIKYHLDALEIQTEVGDSLGLFTSKVSLAQAYSLKKQYALAIKNGEDALGILKAGGGQIEMYMDVYKVLAEIYRGEQDFKKALDAYSLYNTFKDSLVKDGNSKTVSDMLAKYDSDKKDLEIRNTAYKLQQRQLVIGGLAIVIVLLIISAYLFYNRYKLKKEKELDTELIKQQELRNKAIIEAEERERIRIAKDLHDGIGQQLAAVKLNMNAMEEDMSGNMEQLEKLKVLEHMVDDTLKEVRAVSHNMMPNALIRKGLAAAVREFIDNIAATGLLKVDLQIVGLNERLEGTMETVLYRVLQETVSNIIKHAQASKISIQLIRHEGYLNFILEDNGKGFDASDVNNFSGIGLKNIVSRIQYLNGTVDFDSAIGKGTTVIIEVPLI